MNFEKLEKLKSESNLQVIYVFKHKQIKSCFDCPCYSSKHSGLNDFDSVCKINGTLVSNVKNISPNCPLRIYEKIGEE